MTVHTLTAKIPSITIVEGLILKLEAISPTTGAAVAGVNASRWAIYGSEAGDALEADIVPRLPLLTYGPESSGL